MAARPIHAAAAILCGILAAGIGCARKSTAHVPASPSPVQPAKIGSTETGIASWYGHPYHGRRAASGEIYDMEQFTAAHRTLPFGTWLEVTNLQNRKVVDVRINDRGPFVDGRIIDLSLAAARVIGLVGPGIARVQLKVIAAPDSNANASPPRRLTAPPGQIPSAPVVEFYAVQAGSFSDRARAESFQAGISSQFEETRVLQIQLVWRVLVGREMTLDDANKLAAKVLEVAGQALVVKDR